MKSWLYSVLSKVVRWWNEADDSGGDDTTDNDGAGTRADR